MACSYRFVVMEGPPADYPAKFRRAIDTLELPAEINIFPHMWSREITRARIGRIRELVRRRHADEIVFFCPGALELFLEEPDFSFHFSAYRPWFDPSRTAVLPHPWNTVSPKDAGALLRWSSKPPCNVGFMGTSYGNSRVGRLAAAMPSPVRRRILDGQLRRSAERIAWLYEHGIPFHFLPTFARFETLEAVARARWPEGARIEITDTGGFDGSELRKNAFADHLEQMTYVLCPRGCENYSFRVYEALRFGRVPVIIDTKMVLPPNVDWEEVALIIPGDAPDEIPRRILEDHRSRSEEQFLKRQQKAFETSAWLDRENWLVDAVRDAVLSCSPLPLPPNGG